MRILCIGDIVGGPGRKVVAHHLPALVEKYQFELVIANAENAAGGAGITAPIARELFALPIDVLTGGNHTWRHKEVISLLTSNPRVLRPLNYPDAPGNGWGIFESRSGKKIAVINVMGRIFMDPLPSPFDTIDDALAHIQNETRFIVVDIHAEATSEKRALGWYLDGRVSAIYGTHTHVATADEEILPKGTGYITDIGMTGPYDSVIGMKKELILRRLTTMRPTAFECATGDPRLCGVIFELDPETGRTVHIERLRLPLEVSKR